MAARLLRVTILAPVTGERFAVLFGRRHDVYIAMAVQSAIDARLDVVEGGSYMEVHGASLRLMI